MTALVALFCFTVCIFYSEGLSPQKIFRSQYQRSSQSKHLLNAKVPSYQEQEDIAARVQKYVQMREIQKMKARGASSEEVANAVKNGTFVGAAGAIMNKKGYQKFLGKGTLDQRLRAVVAYKRSSIASDVASGESELTPSEQRELDAMMDSEDGDDDDIVEDDEEEMYESMVLKIIEDNKLSDLKRNFLLDKDAQREAIDEEKELVAAVASLENDISIEAGLLTEVIPESDLVLVTNSTTIVSTTILNINGTETTTTEVVAASTETAPTDPPDDDDMYTPKSSAWGVFQRPRDVSKTFGGGRVITRAEMNRMDDEYEARMKSGQKAQKLYINEISKVEDENTDKIKDAVSRSRNLMGMGNRQKAVEVLEQIKPFISWHSELGGETYLEIAMALETVDRTDEAREIYGKLVTINWSQKTKRNALQLLQGLDITLKIRQQGMDSTYKPMSDAQAAAQSAAMSSIQEALRPGLTNAWNEYKKGDAQPWFDDGGKEIASIRIDTFKDAFYLLERVFSPLQKIPSALMNKAFRKMYLSADTEKLELLKERGMLDIDKKKKRVTTVSDALDPFIPGLNSRNDDPFSKKKETDQLNETTIAMEKKEKDRIKELEKSKEVSSVWGVSRDKVVTSTFQRAVNGTWDLVAHLSDVTPYTATRFEPGAVRRTLDLPNQIGSESYPVLWGLSTAKLTCTLEYDTQRSEMSMSGTQLPQSKAPWQNKKSTTQTFQVQSLVNVLYNYNCYYFTLVLFLYLYPYFYYSIL